MRFFSLFFEYLIAGIIAVFSVAFIIVSMLVVAVYLTTWLGYAVKSMVFISILVLLMIVISAAIAAWSDYSGRNDPY